jgi:hypothetical protein
MSAETTAEPADAIENPEVAFEAMSRKLAGLAAAVDGFAARQQELHARDYGPDFAGIHGRLPAFQNEHVIEFAAGPPDACDHAQKHHTSDFSCVRGNENPQTQVERYVRQLQGGGLSDVKGRPIKLDDRTVFHCFIVADIVGKLDEWTYSWQRTADGRGRLYQPQSGFRGSIELIGWDALLGDARAPRAKPKRPRIDHFLSHALTAQTGEETSLRELYAEYRAYARPKGKARFATVGEELDALLRFNPVYEALEKGTGDADVAWLGRKLATWEVATVYPLVFATAVRDRGGQAALLCGAGGRSGERRPLRPRRGSASGWNCGTIGGVRTVTVEPGLRLDGIAARWGLRPDKVSLLAIRSGEEIRRGPRSPETMQPGNLVILPQIALRTDIRSGAGCTMERKQGCSPWS